MNILAVDDDELQLAVLSATLLDRGLPSPTTTTSAAAALRAIHEALAPFDLFLLDIRMPGTDGIALCKLIRSMSDYRDAPVIMITGLSDRKNMERAFAAGAIDYVTKPFDKMELATRIKVAAQLSKAKADARCNERDLADLRRDVIDSSGTGPEHPTSILGIPNVVDYYVFRNFILEMPFASTFSASAFAVKINRYDYLHRKINRSDIYEILGRVANALSKFLQGHGYLVTHAGSGTFVCCTLSTDGILLEDLLGDIQAELDDVRVSDSSGAEVPIDLIAGQVQRNGLVSLNRRAGLLHRAMADLQRRAMATPAQRAGRIGPTTSRSGVRKYIGGGHA